MPQRGNVIDRDRALELVLTETIDDADRAARPDGRVFRALRDSRVLGLAVPAEYGGSAADSLAVNRCVARIAEIDPSTAIILFQHFAVCARIAEWGTDEQRAEYLPRLATGEWIAASAWSEVGAGANKRNIGTRAERTPTGWWRLTGKKSFTTGAGVADLYLVLAQSDPRSELMDSLYGNAGQTFFLVEAAIPGVVTDSGPQLVGMRNSATGAVELRGCEVPADAMLGAEGDAPKIIASVRESGVTLGAVSVGIAYAALDSLRRHATRRPEGETKALLRRAVDLEAWAEAARSIVDSAGRRDRAEPGTTTLYSKLFASVAAEEICHEVSRLLGSSGFIAEHPVNRLARDARAIALMGPTNELCRELVSAQWTW